MKYAQTYTSNAAYEADDQKGYPHISLISGGTLIYDVTAPPVIDKKVLVEGMPPEEASANLGAFECNVSVGWIDDSIEEPITTSDFTVTINDFILDGVSNMNAVNVEEDTILNNYRIGLVDTTDFKPWSVTFTVNGEGIPNTPYTVSYTPPTE